MTWSRVRLGDVLEPVPRPVDVDAAAEYREIGIRSHGRGLFHKEPVSGAALGNKKVFWVEPGDFVLNIVFAWEGAVGIVSEAEAGMIGSHRFPMFRPDAARLDTRFLLHYFRTKEGLNALLRVSPGGAGRNRTLSKKAFLDLLVPLPHLEIQVQAVRKVEALQAHLAEALALRSTSDGLLRKTRLALVDAEAEHLAFEGTLADVLTEKPRNGWSPVCDNMEGGTPVLALGAVTGFRYQPSAIKRTSAPVDPTAHYWLQPQDLMITRSNTPALVGHAAIYSGEPTPCIYPDLMMRLRVNTAKALPGFVHWMLQASVTRRYLTTNASGTSPTMRKINQGTVMNTPFPAHVSLVEQARIVDRLSRMSAALAVCERHAEQSKVDIEALRRSVLTAAFAPAFEPRSDALALAS